MALAVPPAETTSDAPLPTVVLVALQGAVGLDQYETHLPAELVWVHVGLACGAWLAAVWATCAAGRLEPRGSRISADRRLKGDLGAPTPVKFPGN